MIEGTAQAWLDALTYRRVWEEARDATRIAEAFRALVANSRAWPAPHDLLASLPEPTAQPRIGRESGIPATRAGRIQRLAEVLGAGFNPRAVDEEVAR